MKKLEQLKTLPWKIILPVAILLVTIALNIWLGCMPVFKSGSYVGNTKHWSIKISFDNTTYNGIEQAKTPNYLLEGLIKLYGFYYVDGKFVKFDGANGSLYEIEETNIRDTFGKKYKDVYDRNSVFSLSTTKYTGQHVWSDTYEDIVCINYGAVFLQVFYCVIYIVSLYYLKKAVTKLLKEKKQQKQDEKIDSKIIL